MPVTVDDTAWPIVVVSIVGSLSEAEEDTFVTTTTGFPARGDDYVAIIDLTDAGIPSGRFIRHQAQAQKEHRAALHERCLGVAFIIQSVMLRGALRAVLHLQSLPCPQLVVQSREEARAQAHLWIAGDTPT